MKSIRKAVALLLALGSGAALGEVEKGLLYC